MSSRCGWYCEDNCLPAALVVVASADWLQAGSVEAGRFGVCVSPEGVSGNGVGRLPKTRVIVGRGRFRGGQELLMDYLSFEGGGEQDEESTYEKTLDHFSKYLYLLKFIVTNLIRLDM